MSLPRLHKTAILCASDCKRGGENGDFRRKAVRVYTQSVLQGDFSVNAAIARGRAQAGQQRDRCPIRSGMMEKSGQARRYGENEPDLKSSFPPIKYSLVWRQSW